MLKQRDENNQISIIIPTYNESENIIKILRSIGEIIPKNITTQAIVVDDNSPDGTGKLVEDYLKNLKKITDYTIEIIHRKTKDGLGSAILRGIPAHDEALCHRSAGGYHLGPHSPDPDEHRVQTHHRRQRGSPGAPSFQEPAT